MKNLGQVTDDQDIARKQDIDEVVGYVQNEIENLQTTVNINITRLNQNVTSLNSAIDDIETTASNARSTANSANTTAQAAKTLAETLDGRVTNLENSNFATEDFVVEQTSALDETVTALSNTVNTHISNTSDYESQITTNTQNISTNTTNITNLDGRVDTLETTTSTNSTNISTIQARIEELKYLNDVVSEQVDERTNVYFGSSIVMDETSSDYTYTYTTFGLSVSRYLLLWGVTHTKNRKTITLPFPMADTDYTVVLSDVYTAKTAYAYAMSHSHTTTSFTTVTGDNSTFRFIVIGRLA